MTSAACAAWGGPDDPRIGRRRLLSLCHACELDPHEGDELNLADLVGRTLAIRIGHDTYDGKPCVRVLGYRPL